MRTIRLIATALALLVGIYSHADPGEDFTTLLHDAWEWRLNEFPVSASQLGDRRKNDEWSDLSLTAIERRHQDRREFLRRLRAIDSSQLSANAQLDYDLFRRELESSIDAHQFRSYLMPISQRGGVQSLESTAETIRLANVKDYEDWLVRMAGVETMIEQTMELQEEGRKTGYMPPQILIRSVRSSSRILN
jgi:prolyl oligopeptidase